MAILDHRQEFASGPLPLNSALKRMRPPHSYTLSRSVETLFVFSGFSAHMTKLFCLTSFLLPPPAVVPKLTPLINLVPNLLKTKELVTFVPY